jgi:hypothetical protein
MHSKISGSDTRKSDKGSGVVETQGKQDGDSAVKSAFGAVNRAKLIDAYFSQQSEASISPEKAWEHVYRLLLWVDQTTGLGHCYESDKSQPGKRWYARSLAFHDWVSKSLDTSPSEVAKQIDWLFLRAAEDLAAYVIRRAANDIAKAEAQRRPYEGRDFPKPGEDPELVSIIRGGFRQSSWL